MRVICAEQLLPHSIVVHSNTWSFPDLSQTPIGTSQRGLPPGVMSRLMGR